jgi:hypothetical protein
LANGVLSVSLGRPQRLLRIPLVPGTASFGPSGTVSPVGNLETRRTIVDVRDLNRRLILLLDRGKSGEVYNLSNTL